jgi:aryl-alcohol dehydrogenase-like predicted oxidoreductase
MQYRTLGRTGMKVSEIGLGGHREGMEMLDGLARTARFFRSPQERAAVVGAAIDGGVTYFDTTFGCEIQSLGESLRLLKRRDGLFCSAMRVDFFSNYLREKGDVRAYLRRELEGRLREFGFDHVEQFLMGALESGDPLSHPRSLLEDAIAEFLKLRDEGNVRCIGFSCHNADYAARLLDAHPAFDTVMVPYNFVNRSAEGRLADALRATGASLVAMKPLVWHVYGLPVTVLRNLCHMPGRPAIGEQTPIGRLAMQFILGNPLVAACVSAANSIAAVQENVAASGAGPLTQAQLAALDSYAAAMAGEDFVPMGIAGLLEDNLRVRASAISLIRNRLGYSAPDIDWLNEHAEEQARDIAEGFLSRLRKDPRWATYLPSRSSVLA